MYILPPYRFTVYAIGIYLGYMLRTHKNVRLTSEQLYIGWIVATIGFLGTLFASSMMSVYNYKFSTFHAAIFSSIAPIPWCFFFAWVVYTSQLGYKSEFALQNSKARLLFSFFLFDRQICELPRVARISRVDQTLLRHLPRSVRRLSLQHRKGSLIAAFRNHKIRGKHNRLSMLNLCTRQTFARSFSV